MFLFFMHETNQVITEFITWVLNSILRPFGWYTHANSADHQRWFHRSSVGNNRSISFHYQNVWFLKNKFGLCLEFKMEHDSEGTFRLRFSIPFIWACFLVFDIGYLDWISNYVGKYGKASWGFSIDGYGMSLFIKNNSSEYDSNAPKTRWYLYWDSLKGKITYTNTVVDTIFQELTMPAFRSYPETKHMIKFTKTINRWHYSNFLLKDKVTTTWDLSLENPPVFQGKGENSYDQDNDGIFGVSVDGTLSIENATNEYREMVTKRRLKYG